MPLIEGKSKGAFQQNLKAEMQAGKPQKQALAIAYSIQRRQGKKKSNGGEVMKEEGSERGPSGMLDPKEMAMRIHEKHYAKGGEVEDAEELPIDQDNDEDFLSQDEEALSVDDPAEKRKQTIERLRASLKMKSA